MTQSNRLPVRWSSDDISPLEFVNGHAHSLPVIICITGGHSGGDDFHSISTGETFWVNRVHHQKRYVACSGQRLFSIPGDYTMLVRLLSNNGKNDSNAYTSAAMQLSKAVAMAKQNPSMWGTPPRLQFDAHDGVTAVFETGDASKSRLKFDEFDIVDEYDEKYLQACVIDTTRYDNPKVLPVETLLPVYLRITVNVAVGLSKSDDRALFTSWIKTLAGEVDKLAVTPAEPCFDIILLRQLCNSSPNEEKLYEPLALVTKAETYQLIYSPKYYEVNQQSDVGNPYSCIEPTNNALQNETVVREDITPPALPPPRRQNVSEPSRPAANRQSRAPVSVPRKTVSSDGTVTRLYDDKDLVSSENSSDVGVNQQSIATPRQPLPPPPPAAPKRPHYTFKPVTEVATEDQFFGSDQVEPLAAMTLQSPRRTAPSQTNAYLTLISATTARPPGDAARRPALVRPPNSVDKQPGLESQKTTEPATMTPTYLALRCSTTDPVNSPSPTLTQTTRTSPTIVAPRSANPSMGVIATELRNRFAKMKTPADDSSALTDEHGRGTVQLIGTPPESLRTADGTVISKSKSTASLPVILPRRTASDDRSASLDVHVNRKPPKPDPTETPRSEHGVPALPEETTVASDHQPCLVERCNRIAIVAAPRSEALPTTLQNVDQSSQSQLRPTPPEERNKTTVTLISSPTTSKSSKSPKPPVLTPKSKPIVSTSLPTPSSKSLSDIPDDISGLSVVGVADCLHQLKLSEYVDAFRRKDVDGTLLRCLDEQMLVDDFGMSRVDALRLILFAQRGWKPNRDGQTNRQE